LNIGFTKDTKHFVFDDSTGFRGYIKMEKVASKENIREKGPVLDA
jgi:hypothetical protein